MFEAAGIRCGLMGTVAYRIGDTELAATRTTPEAPELHGILARMGRSPWTYRLIVLLILGGIWEANARTAKLLLVPPFTEWQPYLEAG